MTNKNYPFFRNLVKEVIVNNKNINVVDSILSQPEGMEYIKKNCLRKGAVDASGIANCICYVEHQIGVKFTVDEMIPLANRIFNRIQVYIGILRELAKMK